MRYLAVSCAALALALPVLAEPPAPTEIAFEAGRFEEAARLASHSPGADAQALAARALLAKAMCGEGQPPADLLARAEYHARQALARETDHVEGRLQLAIAQSLRARGMSVREARRAGLGSEPRRLVESVLADAPGNAYAHGFLAVWHIEVVRRGGGIGAAIMGASVRDGLDHYDAARRAAPDDASIHWQVARALAALNARKYRGEIEAALARARSAGDDDALESVMAARADRLAAALGTLDRREVEALAAGML